MKKNGIKVLIVEDEESVRAALARILESYGHDVVTAADCGEGVERFSLNGDIDIVFTDLSLPGPSGWELAALVKKKRPDVPIVLLSGWDIRGGEMKDAHNVERILAKPVKIKELVGVIAELVHKSAEG